MDPENTTYLSLQTDSKLKAFLIEGDNPEHYYKKFP